MKAIEHALPRQMRYDQTDKIVWKKGTKIFRKEAIILSCNEICRIDRTFYALSGVSGVIKECKSRCRHGDLSETPASDTGSTVFPVAQCHRLSFNQSARTFRRAKFSFFALHGPSCVLSFLSEKLNDLPGNHDDGSCFAKNIVSSRPSPSSCSPEKNRCK